jgi:energy-coupling factor transport system substrate-specific component
MTKTSVLAESKTRNREARRLSVRDLINTGLFSALYIATFFVTGFVGVIPILQALLPLILPIATGIPFMLYLTRVHRFGMVSITGVLVALMMFGSGHGWPVLVVAPLAALLGDLVLRLGSYKRWSTSLIGFGVFSLWVMGPMLPFFIARDSFADYLADHMGNDYAEAVLNYIPTWYLLVLPVLVAVGSVIGGYLGRATLRKHFERAGIA